MFFRANENRVRHGSFSAGLVLALLVLSLCIELIDLPGFAVAQEFSDESVSTEDHPLDFFLEEKRLKVKYCTRPDFGTTFRIYEFSFEEHRIWGATAAILLRLIGLISNEKTT